MNWKSKYDDKYAEFIIKFCFEKYKDRSLLIVPEDKEQLDFVECLRDWGSKIGFNKIEIKLEDPEDMANYLNDTRLEDIELNEIFDKTKLSKYALNGDCIIHIGSFNPITYNVDREKNKKSIELMIPTIQGYINNNTKYTFPWLIIGYPTTKWANFLFPNDKNAYQKLYTNIIKACMLDKEDSIGRWHKFIDYSNSLKQRFNEDQYEKFIIENNLGTNLELGMLPQYQFLNIDKVSPDGNHMIDNFPSYEIFTTPDYRKINGIVYNSKPLVYSNQIIDDFVLEFKNGIVTDFECKVGKNLLESILSVDGGNRLGEFAMVDMELPLSKMNTVFYDTLYDENSSCHLALGRGNPTCLIGTTDKSNENLLKNGVNVSSIHTDFMFGNDKTNIYGVKGLKKKLIMKNGIFVDNK